MIPPLPAGNMDSNRLILSPSKLECGPDALLQNQDSFKFLLMVCAAVRYDGELIFLCAQTFRSRRGSERSTGRLLKRRASCGHRSTMTGHLEASTGAYGDQTACEENCGPEVR